MAVIQPAHDFGHEVVEGLQRFGSLFGAIVYLRLLGIAEPRQLPDPGGFVCDILLVKGWQARGLEAVVGVLVARCWRSRTVRGPWSYVGEERISRLRGGADERFCLVRYPVRFIVCRARAVVDDSAIVVDLVVVVTAAARVREPPIPARRFALGVRVLIEILAEEACPVARRIQKRRYVVLLVPFVPVGLQAAARTLVGPDPGVVGVLAPHDGGPGGTTERVGDEGVREAHALVPQDGASLRHEPEVISAHVIGQDEDDIGFGGSSRRLPSGASPDARHYQYCKGHRNRHRDSPSHVEHSPLGETEERKVITPAPDTATRAGYHLRGRKHIPLRVYLCLCHSWCVSRRARLPRGYDPKACVQRPGYSAGSLLPERELLGPEIARVHRGVLDFVSAGRDDLPDPLLPEWRNGMVSPQVIKGHSYQTFVVVGPQGVAAVAQQGTQHDPHPSSSFPSQGSLFIRELWQGMYIMIRSSGLPGAKLS